MVVYGTVSTARAALEVLADADQPLALGEIRHGVARRLDRDVPAHSLRAAIYYHLQGDSQWFARVDRGRYALTEVGKRDAAASAFER